MSLIRQLATEPGFAMAKARRLIGFLRAMRVFRGCERGHRVCATGYVRMKNHGRVVLGDRATFLGGMIPSVLTCHPGGTLEVGEGCVFNYGVSIEAHHQVRIGRRCMVASGVRICDEHEGRQAPVVVGDDVWIAHGASLKPGVTIGAGSVVSAGSVVVRDVPPDSLAIGNPARCMGLSLMSGGDRPREARSAP